MSMSEIIDAAHHLGITIEEYLDYVADMEEMDEKERDRA